MDKYIFTNALEFARSLCSQRLKPGDTAVDATMGNGNDTVLLAQLVGESGKVLAASLQGWHRCHCNIPWS